MKFLAQFSRFLVACLFIFSGLIKSNDPTGFTYKLEEYFSIFSNDLKVQQDSVKLCCDGQIVSTHVLMAKDKIKTLSVQSSDWETTLNGDSIHPDTAYKSSFIIFIDNQPAFKTTISNDTSFDYELLINNTSLYNGKTSFKRGEVLQSEKKISVENYVLKESFWVGFFMGMKKYALFIAIFICVLEVLLGFGLLIGWNPKLIGLMIVLLLIGFTYLTWYSATFNKVTDCGCFGDAIKLTPYQSFYKDLALLFFTLLILIGARYIKPLFSNIFSINFLAFVTIFATSFAIYCEYYLPVYNFLQFRPGNDIRQLMQTPKGKRQNDHIIITYLYNDKNGKPHEVVYDSDNNTFTPAVDYENWTYVKVVSENMIEPAYKPPIHDFKIQDSYRNDNFTDSFFKSGEYKLLAVFHDVNKTNVRSIKKLIEIATEWQAEGYTFWALTASSSEDAEEFRHKYQLPFDFYFGDDTNLKSIIRSNPGLLLFSNYTMVKATWPSTNLPKTKKILKLTKK